MRISISYLYFHPSACILKELYKAKNVYLSQLVFEFINSLIQVIALTMQILHNFIVQSRPTCNRSLSETYSFMYSCGHNLLTITSGMNQ